MLFKIVGLIIILSFFTACTTTTPHENFKAHMSSDVGKGIYDTHTWARPDRYIGMTNLPNGNVENEYIFNGTCRYFFEFNQTTNTIVNWRFEGDANDCEIFP